jgi:hypothetical protein
MPSFAYCFQSFYRVCCTFAVRRLLEAGPRHINVDIDPFSILSYRPPATQAWLLAPILQPGLT